MSQHTSTRSSHRRLIAALSILAMVGGLAACSLAGFGYDIAPRLAVRYADDYLHLNTRQEAKALELFRERKTIHQQDELPQYAVFMMDLERRLQRGLTHDDFNHAFERVNQLWDVAVERTVPAIATILADLDDDQLEALEESLADSEERYRERIRDHDPEERREERFEDIEEWTGDLSEEQRAFVEERFAQLNDTRVAWLEWRIQRNQRLVDLLKKKPGREEIEAFMISSWARRDDIDPELEKATEENRAIYRRLLVDLAARLNPDQEEAVAEKLAEYREIVWDLLPEDERLALQERRENGTLFDSAPEEVAGTQ